MKKALILSTFHRFVFVAEGQPERKEQFPAGKTVTEGENGVTADDIADWIAKGLARAAGSSVFETAPA